MLDIMLFAVFPYVSVAMAVVVGLYRLFVRNYTFLTFSSQFLEHRRHFWGMIPWHIGIITILAAHTLAFLFPDQWDALISPIHVLQILETIGLALGISTVVGLAVLFYRRLSDARARAVTRGAYWILGVVLFPQVATGLYIAFVERWGSAWFVASAAPWLWSLVLLQPQVDYVADLPTLVQLHFLGGFLLLAMFSFTRLPHFLVFPMRYLWRPFQLVIWNSERSPRGAKPVMAVFREENDGREPSARPISSLPKD